MNITYYHYNSERDTNSFTRYLKNAKGDVVEGGGGG